MGGSAETLAPEALDHPSDCSVQGLGEFTSGNSGPGGAGWGQRARQPYRRDEVRGARQAQEGPGVSDASGGARGLAAGLRARRDDGRPRVPRSCLRLRVQYLLRTHANTQYLSLSLSIHHIYIYIYNNDHTHMCSNHEVTLSSEGRYQEEMSMASPRSK